MAAPAQLTCERDGTSTRLTCVRCATPICPLCLVRTPVGMKCPTCGAEPGAMSRAPRSRWVVLAPVLVVAAVALAVVAPRALTADKPKVHETVNPFVEARPAAPYTFGGIGREVVDQNLSFVVKSVDCGAAPLARPAQGKFCVVTLTIRNVSRNAVTFDSKTQVLSDGTGGTGRRFQVDPTATAAHPANTGIDMLNPVVNPGNELTGALVYDVPQDAKPLSLTLHAGTGGFGAIIALPAG